jgi:adenylylsulfate kinase-like enzyme
MGLSGSGKSTLAEKLSSILKAKWINADVVRKTDQNFDYSKTGRINQAYRMKKLADKKVNQGHIVVADFICPTVETRKIFNADFTIWMDTIAQCDFEDTNEMFEKPIVANGDNADIIIKEKNADAWVDTIVGTLNTLGNN